MMMYFQDSALKNMLRLIKFVHVVAMNDIKLKDNV